MILIRKNFTTYWNCKKNFHLKYVCLLDKGLSVMFPDESVKLICTSWTHQFIISANEVMFLPLSVFCLCVSRIAQKVVNEFWWIFCSGDRDSWLAITTEKTLFSNRIINMWNNLPANSTLDMFWVLIYWTSARCTSKNHRHFKLRCIY